MSWLVDFMPFVGAVLCGLFNAMRGSGQYTPWLSRTWAMLWCSLTVYVGSLPDINHFTMEQTIASLVLFTAIWLLLTLASSFAVGPFFSAFHGFDRRYETEEKFPISLFAAFGNMVQPEIKTMSDSMRWGVAAFTARAMPFYFPFIAVGFFNVWALLIGLSVFSMGIVYGSTRYLPDSTLGFNRVRIAEFCYYNILGYALIMALRGIT